MGRRARRGALIQGPVQDLWRSKSEWSRSWRRWALLRKRGGVCGGGGSRREMGRSAGAVLLRGVQTGLVLLSGRQGGQGHAGSVMLFWSIMPSAYRNDGFKFRKSTAMPQLSTHGSSRTALLHRSPHSHQTGSGRDMQNLTMHAPDTDTKQTGNC